MNPLMGGRMGNLMQVMSQVSRLRQNPNGIADLLKQQGRINDDQYAEIQKMNDPAQIGQYLIQSGVMPQQQAMQAAQTIVPQIQQQMK